MIHTPIIPRTTRAHWRETVLALLAEGGRVLLPRISMGGMAQRREDGAREGSPWVPKPAAHPYFYRAYKTRLPRMLLPVRPSCLRPACAILTRMGALKTIWLPNC
jgi:hypothetical protein